MWEKRILVTYREECWGRILCFDLFVWGLEIGVGDGRDFFKVRVFIEI